MTVIIYASREGPLSRIADCRLRNAESEIRNGRRKGAERSRVTRGLSKLGNTGEKRRRTMCEGKRGCQRPEELVGKPEECSPEQIKKCHGDVKVHPCVTQPEEE